MTQGYYNQSEVTTLGDIARGIKVERVATAVTTGTESLFTVIDGRIVLRDLVGEVVTTLGSVATNIHIAAAPTAGGATAMSTTAGAIEDDIASVKYTLPATVAAHEVSTGDAIINNCPRWIIPPGTIDLVASATPGGGTVKWTLQYVPFDHGAYVEAA